MNGSETGERLFAFFNAGESRINENAATILTHDNFLVHADFKLFLRWNAVETATAGITLDVDDAKTITGVLADALEGIESTGIDTRFECFCLFAETLFVLACLAHDFLKLAALFVENVSLILKLLIGECNLTCLVFDSVVIFVDVLLAELYFKSLKFDFL